ncbi:unnamed protein product [marine sediment metagenome]|uniref:Uncharacterized protein n=1 Tax=marine sediment metagenome TaxID=412755 RepID=X1HID9_9ZZZZ
MSSTSGVTKTFQYDSLKDVLTAILREYRPGKPLSWQQGGYISKLSEGILHPGEYVLPKKIVDLLNLLVSRPPSPAQVLARERPSPISPSPMPGTTDTHIHFYGDVILHGVQDVDAFMEELHRRSRVAGARL